jgi:uncharacterized protein (TIGR04141 family)
MPKVNLTSFLIKEGYEEFLDVIKNDIHYDVFPLKAEHNLDGLIVVGTNSTQPPQWLEVLQEMTEDPIQDLFNSSTRSVLMVRCEQRIFVFPFGFGRYLINDAAIVKDFGIKVVLNSVLPHKLRSIDTATVNEITIHSRTQTSKTTSVNSFGIDVVKDFLKSVTGEPANKKLGKVVTGKESIQLTYELEESFNEFNILCTHLLDRYYSSNYKENFSWVDNLQLVNDSLLKNILNQKLLEKIHQQDDNMLHIAPPEIVDWSNIGGFTFTPNSQTDDDLDINNYFNYINRFERFELDHIKRHSVYVWDVGKENQVAKWKLYDCIVFETDYEDNKYILTMGSWFKVDEEFANLVEGYIREIPDAMLTLPECGASEKEGEYNLRVGNENEDMITLDTKNVNYNGSQIEICDLLTSSGQLIHVKPWKSSSTLSHLFSQGRVSAESLFQDKEFRILSNAKVKGINEVYANHIKVEEFDPTELEIVFAIIDKNDRDLHERLPFFSKLNMMQSVKHLRNLRYNVSKCKIRRVMD